MSIFGGLEQIVETEHPLAKYTWYGLGGPAEYFIRPRTVDELAQVVACCQKNDVAMSVMGCGSNLLVGDEGVRGAVIKLGGEQFGRTDFDGDEIVAWAGVELASLVFACVKRGLSGIEGLTGIPGSIGGSVRMNAGGRFGDIGSVVESVTLMDSHGTVFEKAKPELSFDYRTTNIAARFILNAKLRLTGADPDQVLRAVKESWMYKKNNQPLNTRTCGCVFKNPPGQSAGAMIDRAGLKGLKVGGALVSEKHANFIVATEGCTSRDVLQLIETIRKRVKEQFDVELETEIEIWA